MSFLEIAQLKVTLAEERQRVVRIAEKLEAAERREEKMMTDVERWEALAGFMNDHDIIHIVRLGERVFINVGSTLQSAFSTNGSSLNEAMDSAKDGENNGRD
jgi:hypothetical protein